MRYFIILSTFIFFISCKKENNNNQKTPIVFVHGFLASGDTYEKQVKRFTSNGYTLDEIYAFDYNSLDVLGNPIKDLDKYIDEVLKKTKSDKVNLVGHSRGAALVYDYCNDYLRSKKIQNLVMLAGFLQAKAAGTKAEISTLNIYSTDDKIVVLSGDVKGADNLKLTGKDHYEVATCKETFERMFKFFNNNSQPSSLDIIPEESIILSGKAASFGENVARQGTTVEIYEIDATSGFRINDSANAIYQTDSKGNWGSFKGKTNTYYEFVVSNPSIINDRKVHYFREPFLRSDKLIYLRTFPVGSSIAAAFLASLPKDDNQSVVAFFGASQGLLQGRDELLINGYNYSNNTFATSENTTIALFLYDDNRNNQTDNSSIPAFALFPFLKGADAYFQTQTPATIQFQLNGRKIPVRNWKSKSDGVCVAVYE
jgi:predicted esterase